MAANAQSSRRLSAYRFINPVIRFLVRRGVGVGGSDSDLLRTLRITGRSSGRVYEVPVRVAVINGDRYVMTMGGETQWARNLRASGVAQLISRGRTEQVAARELTGPEKFEFLSAVCREPQFANRARATLQSTRADTADGIDIQRLGDLWYPFQLTTGDA